MRNDFIAIGVFFSTLFLLAILMGVVLGVPGDRIAGYAVGSLAGFGILLMIVLWIHRTPK